jgi:hypothetical protein
VTPTLTPPGRIAGKHQRARDSAPGESDDALVENVNEHIATKHRDMVGKYSREILERRTITEPGV